ncbi:hypothetical protein G6F43_011847 [Rhizopus delemar]|nr:hypothetical protein G6F43_011847 [Rhizopus delemar]
MHIVQKNLPQAMVYLDDVLVFSKTEEQHAEDVKLMLQRLDEYNLKISKKKCQFFQREVKFLGFLVSGEGIRSDPEKIKAIKDWPIPTSVKQLMQFLGFCAFHHRFIKNLYGVAKLLYYLLKKEEVLKWSEEANRAFENLKKQIMTLPTLAYPNPALAYDLHCRRIYPIKYLLFV